MDDLDALLEDLQAVVPRSDRPPANGTPNAGNRPPASQNNGYSPALNSNSSDTYGGGGNSLSAPTTTSNMSGNGGSKMISPITQASSNLAELDSLLESLNSPSLGMDLDDEALRALGVPDGGFSSKPAGGGVPLRPDVGNLLSDLDKAVTVPGSQPAGDGGELDFPPPPANASTATRDLDALMASLNDFQLTTSSAGAGKVLSSKPAGHELYAEPKTMLLGRDGVVAPERSSGGSPALASPADSTKATSGGSGSGSNRDTATSAARLSQLDSMLGHLQSDISRQGISSSSKGTCSACQQDIVGQVITALGRTWHPQHFACVCCKEELATKNFFEREGKAYCEKDYHEKFAPKCAYCAGPILERCMTALGKTWHPEHFFCAHCGKPFGATENFHEKDGRPYCRDHYYELFAPKCGACERPIVDSFVSALKKQWHPECFNCMECGEPFKGGNFFEHDLMPYCEKHYYNRQGAMCSQCQKPVSGRCISAMGQKYHPEHFVCVFCMKQLNMGTFKEHGDRPYCMKCYGKLFG